MSKERNRHRCNQESMPTRTIPMQIDFVDTVARRPKNGNKAQELRGGTHKATAQRTNSQTSNQRMSKKPTGSPAKPNCRIGFAKVKWDKAWQGQRSNSARNPTGPKKEKKEADRTQQAKRIKIQTRSWRLKNKRERDRESSK